MQSQASPSPKLHVAIIMDGNGRWAERRGLPRTAGHRAGAEAMRRIVKAAPTLGVTTLTMFAFSSYNWRREPREVDGLMRILGDYLRAETQTLIDSGARFSLIGRRDRLPWTHREALARVEVATCNGRQLHVRIAVDYSARQSIVQAAALAHDAAGLGRLIAQASPDDAESTDVDLMIRTGGDQRLSDFLLWESAFAELWFTERMWPDFDEADFRRAITEFHGRSRAAGLAEPSWQASA